MAARTHKVRVPLLGPPGHGREQESGLLLQGGGVHLQTEKRKGFLRRVIIIYIKINNLIINGSGT